MDLFVFINADHQSYSNGNDSLKVVESRDTDQPLIDKDSSKTMEPQETDHQPHSTDC